MCFVRFLGAPILPQYHIYKNQFAPNTRDKRREESPRGEKLMVIEWVYEKQVSVMIDSISDLRDGSAKKDIWLGMHGGV